MSFGQNIYLITAQSRRKKTARSEWDTTFRSFLELLLSRLSGEQVTINMIDVNELDIKKIYTPHTLLVPIVTRELLNSRSFRDEIKLFHEKAINKSVNNISWDSRIFKIVREPQKGHFLLDYLSSAISYDFYHFDTAKDTVVSYVDFTGPNSEKTFWMRLYDLAYDIFKILDGIRSADDEIADITRNLNRITVYLAEVGTDLVQKRDAVKRELLRNGHRVLPERSMPDDFESIVKQVRSDLSKSNLSIHLVGADYGKIEGSNVSIIDLQNRIATELFNEFEALDADQALNFGRVIWISPELENLTVKQRLFIENLKKDSASMNSAELLMTTFEKLKSYVINMIQDLIGNHQKNAGEEEANSSKIIYLIHDKTESQKCKKIVSYLLQNGYEVITPDFSGDPEEIRLNHNENLRKCDASLIYYGKDNQNWFRSKQNDLMKSHGLGRNKPISPQAVLIENESQLIESLDLNQKALVLKGNNDFIPQVIEPFLDQLEE